MFKYALAVAAVLSFFQSVRAHADDYVSAQCQAKLLKVTTDAFVKEFPGQASKFGYIAQVTFNYGMEGTPRTVFFGSKLNEDSKRCLVQVYTTVGSRSSDSCPEYVFSRIDSNCK